VGDEDTKLSDALHSSARPRKQSTYTLTKQAPCKGQGNTKMKLARASPYRESEFQKKMDSS
jgi:hypothetical protein